MPRRRSRALTVRGATILTVAVVVVAALVAGTALVANRVATVGSALADVVRVAHVIDTDVRAADLDALATDLVTLDDRTQALLVAASDPVLGAALDGLPVAGPHLRALRTIAAAASSVTFAARPLASVLPSLDPSSLVVDGQYDTEALSDLDTALRSLAAQVGHAGADIAAIDTDALDPRAADVVTQVSSAVGSVGTLLEQVEPLVGILPIVLGETGRWFVVLQNLAEARGTGGILGAYAVLDVSDGHLSMAASGPDSDLVSTPVPDDGVPADVRAIWGASIDDIRSVNTSPDFPVAGRLYANAWHAHSGQDVDGVLAIGQGMVQYLLAATGPVTIDGETLDAGSVVPFLSYGVYAKYGEVAEKNGFVAELVAEIFSRLQDGRFDLSSLLSATTTTPTSDRLLAWSPHTELQARIETAGYADVLPDGYGPTAAVAINNGSGNKLEQFVDVSVDYALGDCASEFARIGSVEVTLTNRAPTSGLPPYVTPRSDRTDAPVGSTLEILSVYAPVGAGDADATIDGDDVSGYAGVEAGRGLYVFAIDLDPGQSRTLVINWTEPTAAPTVADVLPTSPTLLVPPTLNPWTVTTEEAIACR